MCFSWNPIFEKEKKKGLFLWETKCFYLSVFPKTKLKTQLPKKKIVTFFDRNFGSQLFTTPLTNVPSCPKSTVNCPVFSSTLSTVPQKTKKLLPKQKNKKKQRKKIRFWRRTFSGQKGNKSFFSSKKNSEKDRLPTWFSLAHAATFSANAPWLMLLLQFLWL